MDALQEKLQEYVEGRIDFEGQRLTGNLLHIILISTSVLSFIIGWAAQSLLLTMYIFLGGLTLLTVLIAPPWPIYNRYPVKWLPSKRSSRQKNE